MEDEDDPPKRTNYLYWFVILLVCVGVLFGLYKLYETVLKSKDTLPGYGGYGGYGSSKYK